MSLKAMIWAWEQPVKSHIAKLILLKLADNTNDETGDCHPKHDTIAKHCQCSRRSVIRHIKILAEQGYLTIEHKFIDGQQVRNNYHLNIKKTPNAGVTDCHTGGCQIVTLGGDRESHRGGDRESHHEPVRSRTSKSKLSEKKFSEDDMRLARFIFSKIRSLNKDFKEPNFNSWADTVRLMRERDNRTHKQIQDVFLFAHSDIFWQTNILSVNSLRDKFDVLQVKKNQSGQDIQSRPHPATNPEPPKPMTKAESKQVLEDLEQRRKQMLAREKNNNVSRSHL